MHCDRFNSNTETIFAAMRSTTCNNVRLLPGIFRPSDSDLRREATFIIILVEDRLSSVVRLLPLHTCRLTAYLRNGDVSLGIQTHYVHCTSDSGTSLRKDQTKMHLVDHAITRDEAESGA